MTEPTPAETLRAAAARLRRWTPGMPAAHATTPEVDGATADLMEQYAGVAEREPAAFHASMLGRQLLDHALAILAEPEAAPTVQWIVETRQPDGTWVRSGRVYAAAEYEHAVAELGLLLERRQARQHRLRRRTEVTITVAPDAPAPTTTEETDR